MLCSKIWVNKIYFTRRGLKMKKLFSMILAVLCVSAMAVTAGAAGLDNQAFSIPKANVAPTIDGVMTGDEWDNALVRTLTTDTVNTPHNTGIPCPTTDFYWMWDDAGLYVFVNCQDTTANGAVRTQGAGAYNAGDGIQFNIYPVAGESTNYFWSMVIADDGNAACGEHFVFGGGSGADVPAVEIKMVANGTAYTMEAFYPAEVWEETGMSIEEGLAFPMANIVMEHDGATQELFTDTTWGDSTKFNVYTLTADVAGHVEVETVAEDVAADAPAAAPQTFDMGVIAAVAAIVSAAGYAISKKR